MSELNSPPDQDQRDIILNDLDTTILVEAAAGTGKTTSMVGRMVNLLARGKTGIETLIAVTFTRKAAAELRSRFQVTLEHSLLQSTDASEKIRLQEAINHLERCFIGTIHSFCGKILRDRPIEAGVDIDFIEIDDDEDVEFRKEAWRSYVSDLYRNDSPVLQELESLGIEIGQLEPSFMSVCDYPDVEHWPAPKTAIPDIHVQIVELERYCSHMESIALDLPEDTGNDTLIPKYRAIPLMFRQARHRGEIHDFIPVFEEFLSAVKPVQKLWKSSPSKLEDELAQWNRMRDDVASVLVRKWQEYLYEPLLRAIMGGTSYYDKLRADASRLNFQDLLLKTSGLLRHSPDVRSYFRKCFTHLLVDEFQDTDPVQAEVMLYLTSADYEERDWKKLSPEPGSLFVVGDPKQSIYRFRRADIITYNRVKQMILSSGGRVVNLSSNFRTIGPIIDWVNNSFETEFSKYPENASPDHIPLQKGRPTTEELTLEGVRKLPIPKNISKAENIVEYESDLIASFISHSVSEHLSVARSPKEVQAGVSNMARPDDFLIITPTMKNLHVYNEKLARFGIPTEVTGGGHLSSTPYVFQFYVLLKAIMEPYDPVALLAALRGPLFGASDRDLYDFVSAGGKFNYRVSVPNDVETDFRDRLNRFFQKLRFYSTCLKTNPIISALEFIAADCGIFLVASLGAGGNVASGAIGKALEIMRSSQSSLHTAEDYLNLLGNLVYGRKKSDSAPILPLKESAVRIMNLHKAKGLEAPIVFLADPTGKTDQKPSLRIDRSRDESVGYILIKADLHGSSRPRILATPANWDSLAKEESVFQSAEELRLKYVAATRAGSLMVISNRPGNPNRNLWSFFNSKIESLKELTHFGFPDHTGQDSVFIETDTLQTVADETRTRLKHSAKPTYGLGSVKSLFTSIGKTHYARSSYGAEWGLAIHHMLESLMSSPEITDDHFRSVILPVCEISPELWEEAINLVRRVADSNIWRRALNSRQRFVEMPFVMSRSMENYDGAKSSTIVRGVIDLVFKEADGWVIVDYKSDRAPESRLGGLVDLYGPQIHGYSQAWFEMTGEMVVEKGLYFTHTDRYVVVS